MLIYNYKKEFLGIDESDLKSLGLKDLEELKREASDFADLFVKTPGHIHNFKHVHWIDFITCADSSEESKVIININNKNYKAVITIERIFLVDSPSSKAYIVHLNRLRELSSSDTLDISEDIANKPTSSYEAPTVDTFDSLEPASLHTSPAPVEQSIALTPDPYEAPLDIQIDEEPQGLQESIEVAPEIMEESLDIGDLSLDIEDDLSTQETSDTTTQENFDNGYVFDPSIASDELGLPLELIEEFIEDFITQAKEFKDDLYTALNESDFDNLRILSHKLKGVAANLRIEDALETLTVINSSDQTPVIEENLANFYNIIAKLAGETISVNVPSEVAVESIPESVTVEDAQEDEFTIDFKDDEDDLYSDPIEMSEPEPSIETPEPELNIEMSEPEIIPEATSTANYSRTTAANDIGIDQETFNELFDDYVNESKTILADIKEATANGDYVASSHEAMKLRGMSDNMRVSSFNEELKTIINSSDQTVIDEAINTIDTMISQISKVEV